MNENPNQKCRTCLKNKTKTFPLTKNATGCNPKRTYGQLLREYVKLECTADYERLMPQFICLLCCRELRNAYAFINQAQYCNSKLINAICKKLDCLKERSITLPAPKISSEVDIKQEQDIKINNFSLGSCDAKLELPTNETEGHSEDAIINDTIDDELNASSDLVFDCRSPNNENTETNTICPICEKNISGHVTLANHIRTQHDIETPIKLTCKYEPEPRVVLQCKLCPSKYTSKYTYIYHLKHKHNIETKRKDKPKEKVIKCRSCEYTARTYAALNYHTRSKHGTEKDKFKCKFCSYTYLKKFDLFMHVKNSHKMLIKALKAETENKRDQSPVTFRTSPVQMNKSTNKNEESSSDDNTRSSSAKEIHKPELVSDSNSDVEEEKEQFSDEEFIRNILNIKKRQTKPSMTSLARRCDECGNIYRNYKALYAHQRHVHISEDKYSLCPHCGKKYKRKTDLRIHIEKAHLPQNSTEAIKQPAKVREKRFMCTQCSYVCTTITILNIHINRHHTGEKPYKCDICFKSFIIPYDLKIHRYLHTGERPYKCPICSKGFRDNSHMLKHKRIHSSERPYKCKDCNKTFTQSYNLSVHTRTHLKEKKLNCTVCSKVFENRSLLNIHRINENHHDEVE